MTASAPAFTPANEMLSTGEVARRLGVPRWALHKLYQRKLLPEPGRVGQCRAVAPGDLPAIEEALRQAGYLKG